MSLIGVDTKPAKFDVHDGFLPGQHLSVSHACLRAEVQEQKRVSHARLSVFFLILEL